MIMYKFSDPSLPSYSSGCGCGSVTCDFGKISTSLSSGLLDGGCDSVVGDLGDIGTGGLTTTLGLPGNGKGGAMYDVKGRCPWREKGVGKG